MTDASRTQLAVVSETTPGTTPSSPAFDILRYVDENIVAGVTFEKVNEIRSDRNMQAPQKVGSAPGGPLNCLLSYATFDKLIESLMFGAFTSNILKNGTTKKTLTLEKIFETGATDQYHRIKGVQVDSMTLALQAQKNIAVNFSTLGMSFDSSQAALAGATYTAANENPVMTASNSVGSLGIDGAAGADLLSINLTISNSLRHQPKITTEDNKGIGSGLFEVTGTLQAYFENEDLYELYLDATESDLSFHVGGVSSKKYLFEMDNIKFTGGSVVSGGNGQDVIANMEFTAYLSVDNTLKITRTP